MDENLLSILWTLAVVLVLLILVDFSVWWMFPALLIWIGGLCFIWR